MTNVCCGDETCIAHSVQKMSLKLYRDLAPTRAFIAEHPEFRDEFVKALANGLNAVFSVNFKGPTND